MAVPGTSGNKFFSAEKSKKLKVKENGFGPHLMLDGYDVDEKKLSDFNLIFDILDQLPSRVSMTKIIPPYVFKYSGLRPEDWGITGFVVIAESHISIHTFPAKKYFSFDAFSCKEFDKEAVKDFLKEKLGSMQLEENFVKRGSRFPKT